MGESNLLFLGDVACALALQSAVGGRARFAETPLEAAKTLAEAPPAVVVLRADSAWACDLVASLSASERPAILAVGERTASALGLVDGWLPVDWDSEQAQSCLNRAIAKRDSRRLAETPAAARRGRRALLRALVGGGEKARRQGGALSAVVFRIDGESGDGQRHGHIDGEPPSDVASTLRRHTRRTETCGRLRCGLWAVVVHGGQRTADLARARLELLLAGAGIAATFQAFEIDRNHPVQDVRSRASQAAWQDVPVPLPEVSARA